MFQEDNNLWATLKQASAILLVVLSVFGGLVLTGSSPNQSQNQILIHYPPIYNQTFTQNITKLIGENKSLPYTGSNLIPIRDGQWFSDYS
jgi:hypothetical protein